jgi:DNA-binding response OmpR family regulator
MTDKMRVLVVEDDAVIAEIITLNLEMEGFEPHHAPDGGSGLDAVAKVDPHLVLLDVMMPDMDGWAVLEQLRADPATETLPVIMLTARAMPADQVRGWNLGATGYLTKPFSPMAMVDKVREVIADNASLD